MRRLVDQLLLLLLQLLLAVVRVIRVQLVVVRKRVGRRYRSRGHRVCITLIGKVVGRLLLMVMSLVLERLVAVESVDDRVVVGLLLLLLLVLVLRLVLVLLLLGVMVLLLTVLVVLMLR